MLVVQLSSTCFLCSVASISCIPSFVVRPPNSSECFTIGILIVTGLLLLCFPGLYLYLLVFSTLINSGEYTNGVACLSAVLSGLDQVK